MKITIAPVAAGPSWGSEVELTAGLYASPENLVFNGSSVADLVPVLETLGVIPIDRGNEQNSISFQFTDEKGSFALSEQDLILYKANLPRFGLFRFYAEGSLGGTPFAYMIGAITQFSHHQIGVTTIRNFTLLGGAVVTTQPDPPAPFP